MAKTESRSVNVYINNKVVGQTIKDIQSQYIALNNHIRKNLIPGTAAYNEKVAELRKLGSVISDHTAKVKGMTGIWSKISKEVKQFGLLAISALGAQQLISGINNLIKRNADLSDSFADVRKTTGLTDEAVRDLYKDLGQLNTRTSRKELLDLAREAGKLGISGQKNILDFVRAADKINVALGEDLGKEAITQLGKLAQQFKTVEKFGFEASLEKIGSAINDLGANSAATEGYIVDFTTRLAGVSKQANITVHDTLGLASTLDNLGLTSELSATAISKTIVAMFKDTADFAKIAGMNTKDFTDLLNTDANEALIKVVQGLKGNNEGLSTMAAKLDDLGVDGARTITVLASLADNTELLKQQQDLANKSFEQGVSLTNEFNIKNETLGAKLERVQKAIYGAFISSGAVAALESLVNAAADFISVPLSETLREEQAELNTLVTAIITTNDNQQLRNDLVKELQDQYPDFLKNMDAEKVSNEELRDRLIQVNDEYERRIQLTVFEEDIAKQAKESADAYRDLREAQKQYGQILLGVNAQLDKKITQNYLNRAEVYKQEKELLNDLTLTEEQRRDKLLELAKSGALFFNNIDQGLKKVQEADENYQASIAEGNAILEERNKIFAKQIVNEENIDTVVNQITDDSGKAVEALNKLNGALDEVQRKAAGQIPRQTLAVPEQLPTDSNLPGAQDVGKNPLGLLGLSDDERETMSANANFVVGIYTQLADTISQITQARYQNEIAAINEKEQAEIAAVQNSKAREEDKQARITAIHEKYEKLKTKAQADAAKRNKAIQISQALASAAQAVVSTLAARPGAVDIISLGAVRALQIGLVAAITAAQIGIIARQKFAHGGPTGPGSGRRDETGHYIAGYVHDNEYVVPKRIYQDPQYANVMGLLEAARTGRSFAAGGPTTEGKKYVNKVIDPSTSSDPMQWNEVTQLLRVIAANSGRRLVTVIDDTAVNVITDRQSAVTDFEKQGGIK